MIINYSTGYCFARTTLKSDLKLYVPYFKAEIQYLTKLVQNIPYILTEYFKIRNILKTIFPNRIKNFLKN